MIKIEEILKKYAENAKIPHERSERAEINKRFVEKLNRDRISAGFKPLTPGFYASKMAQAGLKSNHDLYWFYRYCEDAKNFTKCWWWALKVEKS